MKRRRHTPEQIIRKLREADRLLAEGHQAPEVAKQLEISEATYHRWRAQYGGLKADDAKRLKELTSENARLKRLLAEAELEKDALRELAKGTSEPGTSPPRRGPSAARAGPLPTAGLPHRRSAPLHPTPPDDRARPRPSAPRGASAAQPGPSPLGLPARPRPAPTAGLGGQP
jgi:putative transposase